MRDSVREATFKGELNRIREGIQWINDNCSDEQVFEMRQAFQEMVNQPVGGREAEGLRRCSHEVEGISYPPTWEEIRDMPPSKALQKVNSEIRNRLQLMNGFEQEIRELQTLKEKLE